MSQAQRRPPQKDSKKQKRPETDQEYLEAGVDAEEAGEKWRAGDGAKACRFFLKAIDIYEAGLKKHPDSRELAYNKARLQYEICEQPNVSKHQPLAVIDLLLAALDAHRYALAIQTDDADTMFNTAQVMISTSECMLTLNAADAADASYDQSSIEELVKEAIKLLQECLKIQIELLEDNMEATGQDSTQTESEEGQSSAASSSQERNSPPHAGRDVKEERWAIVSQPVTVKTLLDTCLAQLNAWTIYLPLTLGKYDIYKYAMQKVEVTLLLAVHWTRSSEDRRMLDQASYNARVALIEWSYNAGNCSVEEYAQNLSERWSQLPSLAAYGPALCDYADALVSFSASALKVTNQVVKELRWVALSAASEALSIANKHPDTCDRIILNERRGDVEMLRARMTDPPEFHGHATKYQTVLMKNAETYYEGAWRLAAAHTETDTPTADHMLAKLITAKALREENLTETLGRLPIDDSTRVQEVIKEMIEDGLIFTGEL